ncbi:MAG: MerR family transcriptional regulator [Ignavibacteria bacterium]|nr:MerR family transcriptional regulator [Bacteroidota bacterium]MSQ45995.1 MerR family transcriptional regulator [Ignavibacteria bacterium]
MQKANGIKKLYYSISEVSKITELEQYVLRYWETEFEQLNPAKNRAGNRVYTSKDIKLILFIKDLLKEKKYTIEGARQILLSWNNETESGKQTDMFDAVQTNGEQGSQIQQQQKSESLPINFSEDIEAIKNLLQTIRTKLL